MDVTRWLVKSPLWSLKQSVGFFLSLVFLHLSEKPRTRHTHMVVHAHYTNTHHLEFYPAVSVNMSCEPKNINTHLVAWLSWMGTYNAIFSPVCFCELSIRWHVTCFFVWIHNFCVKSTSAGQKDADNSGSLKLTRQLCVLSVCMCVCVCVLIQLLFSNANCAMTHGHQVADHRN